MFRNKLPGLLLTACVAALPLVHAQSDTTDVSSGPVPKFSYDPLGQSKWGDLPDSGVCRSGSKQSPIDITVREVNENLKPIEFDYKAATPVKFAGDPYNFKIDCKGTGNRIKINGMTFTLEEFHFHRPAEEADAGRMAAMSIHLVHKNMDAYKCEGAGTPQCYAVVAIEVLEDTPTAAITALLRQLLTTSTVDPPPTRYINLNHLLPRDRSYFTYQGSLTTPPCREVITWFVLRQTINFSGRQIGQFAAHFPTPNARELQPANGRKPQWNGRTTRRR